MFLIKSTKKWCACIVDAVQKISIRARKARMNYVEEKAMIKSPAINIK